MHTHTHTHTHIHTHSQLELHRRKSEHELPEDALEAELQRLEEELMEGEDDSGLLDSRTDDDLMLDIEEFI